MTIINFWLSYYEKVTLSFSVDPKYNLDNYDVDVL